MTECFVELERLADAGKMVFAKRVEETKLFVRDGHRTSGTWLAGLSGTSVGQAVSELQATDTIEAHPDVKQAFRSGRVSKAQANEIAEAAAVHPEQAASLLTLANEVPFNELKKECLDHKASSGSPESEADRFSKLHASRFLRLFTDADGAGRIEGKFAPDAFALIKAGITSFEDPIYRRRAKHKDLERHDAIQADALVALVKAAMGAPEESDVEEDSSAGRRPGQRRQTPQTLVRMTADIGALLRGYTEPGETCSIPGVDSPIPVSLVRELLGTSLLELVIKEGKDVRCVVSNSRHIPAALRAALEERDQKCAIEGCGATDPLDIDHIVEFDKGGATSADNLVRLCKWHHYLKTHKGWRLREGPGTWRMEQPNRSSKPPGDYGRSGAPPTQGAFL